MPSRSRADIQMSPLPTFFRLAHPEGPVLVRVAPRSSTNSRPLDLELRATDDVRAFVLPCKSGHSHPPLVAIYSLQVAPPICPGGPPHPGPASRPSCGPPSSCSLTPCATPFSLRGPYHGLQLQLQMRPPSRQSGRECLNLGLSKILTLLQYNTARFHATGGRAVLYQMRNGSPV